MKFQFSQTYQCTLRDTSVPESMTIRLRAAIGIIPDCDSVAGILGKQRYVEQRMRHVLREVTLLRYINYQAQRSRFKDFISLICDKSVKIQNLAFLSYWYRKKRLQMQF